MFRVDGHVADVGQGGRQLDDQVAGQNPHHHLGREECREKEVNNNNWLKVTSQGGEDLCQSNVKAILFTMF